MDTRFQRITLFKKGNQKLRGVNGHLRSGWVEFIRRFMADRGKSTSVLSTLIVHPGAKLPV